MIDQSYDGNLEDVLDEIAGQHSIWEVGRNDATGELLIEWCQPGQRTADKDVDIVDYSARKASNNIYRAIVFGASRSVREETFEADVGTAVPLSGRTEANVQLPPPIPDDDVVAVAARKFRRFISYYLEL